MGPLKYFPLDPEFPFKHRGPGYYYYRGNGRWSKYDPERDRMKGGLIGRGPYKQMHDNPHAPYKKRRKKTLLDIIGSFFK